MHSNVGVDNMELILHDIQEVVHYVVAWLTILVEAMGVFFIGVGVFIAAYEFIRSVVLRQAISFIHIRFTLARYLALALEFQLGADILSTAVAPSWDSIGKLAAIAIIRTALNFFLIREMEQQEVRIEQEKARMDRD